MSSGHTSDTLEAHAEELNAIYESGTDALILITNRLDPDNEGDDVFIENAEKLLKLLPEDAKLGLYECPHPYKRLVIKGYSETEFAPDQNIIREQIAAIMHRYAQYKGIDVSVGENTNILSYDDFATLSATKILINEILRSIIKQIILRILYK